MHGINTYTKLVAALSDATRNLQGALQQKLNTERTAGKGTLLALYHAFQMYLYTCITETEFTDWYAQSITYALFAARLQTGKDFTLHDAYRAIPHGQSVAKEILQYIAQQNLPKNIKCALEKITKILQKTDIEQILSKHHRKSKERDVLLHFYESFLHRYNPAERKIRGVYYTPDPLVAYTVRSVHFLLQQKFSLKDGLASEGVSLLDPAAGTMTFVDKAIKVALNQYLIRYGSSKLDTFISEHILKNFHAFELMLAPYIVGHLKIAALLKEYGYEFREGERIPFYLTNTLDMPDTDTPNLLTCNPLTENHALYTEAYLADKVKREREFTVILGNPPYQRFSVNRSKWILKQLEAYQKVNGKGILGGMFSSLLDDYVKFMRFAQVKIEQAGRGIVAMITSHAWLDNAMMRGMRHSLMKTFDEIYIVDLHGNSRRGETRPDGGTDENVFSGIQQGVAIVFLLKHGKSKAVYRADVWGSRKDKYDWLENHAVSNTSWLQVNPFPPMYIFALSDKAKIDRYNSFTDIYRIFEVSDVSTYTGWDRVAIHWSPDGVWETVQELSRMAPEQIQQVYGLNSKLSLDRIRRIQADVSNPSRDKIVPILYRPFDVRYTYFTGRGEGFHDVPQRKLGTHMLAGDNLALGFIKYVKAKNETQNTFVSTTILNDGVLVNYTPQAAAHVPLYLYTPDSQSSVTAALKIRRPNIRTEILEKLSAAYKKHIEPEQVFYYIYAVLCSPYYRETYDPVRRFCTPHIPFPKRYGIFSAMANLGERLVNMHLLRAPELDPPATRFAGEGDCVVAPSQFPRYDPDTQRMYINPTQYFTPVPQAVNDYNIGNNYVCRKWLRARAGRKLNSDEITTYRKIVSALTYTLQIQKQIDEIYLLVEKELLQV